MVKQNSNDPIKKLKDDASKFFQLGIKEDESGHFKNALKLYQKSLSIKKDFGPYVLIGRIYFYEFGDFLKASKILEKAVRFKSMFTLPKEKSCTFWTLLGSCYRELGQYKKAERFYKKALSYKKTVEALVFLGVVYRQLRKYDQSNACFKKAIKIEPKFSESHLNLGINYAQLEKFDLAKEHIEKSIRLDKQCEIGYCELAYANLDQENLNDAERNFRKAIQLKPSLYALQGLGIVLIQKKQFPEAIQVLRRSLLYVPDEEEMFSYLYLAYAYDQANKAAQAKREYKKAIELFPKEAIVYRSYGKFLSSRNNTKAEYYLKKAAKL